MRRQGRARVESPQVDVELPVSEVAGQGVRNMHRNGGLAYAGGAGQGADRRQVRLLLVELD